MLAKRRSLKRIRLSTLLLLVVVAAVWLALVTEKLRYEREYDDSIERSNDLVVPTPKVSAPSKFEKVGAAPSPAADVGGGLDGER